MTELVFLKLGGSLITDKDKPYTPRLDKLKELSNQIAAVLSRTRNLRLVLGHGSGSFGHVAASEYKTRDGLPPRPSPLVHRKRDKNEENYWKGFAEVWYRASMLNRFVMDALHKAGVRTIAVPPSAHVIANNGRVTIWETTPIRMALANGILPVIYGDVVFDEVRGGTILSTEDLFLYLARQLHPNRVLLAGTEAGVWEDFPVRTRLVNEISPAVYEKMRAAIGGSVSADVTGGMAAKVQQMLDLVQSIPGVTAQIFSGEKANALARALGGENVGTLITK